MFKRHTEFLTCIESDDLDKIRACLKREKNLTPLHSTTAIFNSLRRKMTQTSRPDAVYDKFLNTLNFSHRNVESGETPLLVACAMGDIAVVHYLLLKGADPNLANKRNQTPIMVAAYFGHHNIVEHLAHLGGDILQQESEDGNTALMIALQQQRIKAAMSLIDLGAKVNTASNDGVTPLMEAVSIDEGMQVVEALIRKGAGVYKHDHTGKTVLMAAIIAENLTAVQVLLKQDARVDSKSKDGTTALMLAAVSSGSILMLKLLLKYGAQMDSRDMNGNTALSLAIRHNRIANAQCLMEHGADATKKNREKTTAEDYIRSPEMREVFDKYAFRSPNRIRTYKVMMPASPYSQNSPKKTSSSRPVPVRGFSNSSTNSNNSYSSNATYLSDDSGVCPSAQPSPVYKAAKKELFSTSTKSMCPSSHSPFTSSKETASLSDNDIAIHLN